MNTIVDVEMMLAGPPSGAGPTGPEWIALQSELAALAYNVYDPDTFGAVRDDPAAASANVGAIQAAADQAAANNGLLVIKGTYHIDAMPALACHVDGRAGVLIAPETLAPAVRFGTVTPGETLHWLQVILPKIWSTKTGTGWASGVGVEIANVNSCRIAIPHVRGFGTNVRLVAYGAGNAYNSYLLGHLENGKVNLAISPQAGGWINENEFDTGRFHINSNEGVNIPGARHILVTSNGQHPVNNNIFTKPSIEANGPEFHIDLNNAYDNLFVQARYEASPPKVRLNNAPGNDFGGGYGATEIVFTEVGANDAVRWVSRLFQRIRGAAAHGVLILENRLSSASPALTILPAGTPLNDNGASGYAAAIGARYSRFKNGSDTQPRVEIDGFTGHVRFGSGSTPVSAAMGRVADNMIGLDPGDSFYTQGTWDGGHLVLGVWHLWVDGTGKLRMKSSAPTSATDGTVVGTQT